MDQFRQRDQDPLKQEEGGEEGGGRGEGGGERGREEEEERGGKERQGEIILRGNEKTSS